MELEEDKDLQDESYHKRSDYLAGLGSRSNAEGVKLFILGFRKRHKDTVCILCYCCEGVEVAKLAHRYFGGEFGGSEERWADRKLLAGGCLDHRRTNRD